MINFLLGIKRIGSTVYWADIKGEDYEYSLSIKSGIVLSSDRKTTLIKSDDKQVFVDTGLLFDETAYLKKEYHLPLNISEMIKLGGLYDI